MFEGKEESRAEEDSNELHFYYNREERLRKAPQNVRDYYNGNFKIQKGFRVLFKNKSNFFLLITLVMLTVFALIYSKVEGRMNQAKIAGAKTELTAFSYEDTIYISLKILSQQNDLENPRTLRSNFQVINSDGQVVEKYSEEILLQKEEEYIRMKLTDFELVQVTAEVSIGKENASISTVVKR